MRMHDPVVTAWVEQITDGEVRRRRPGRRRWSQRLRGRRRGRRRVRSVLPAARRTRRRRFVHGLRARGRGVPRARAARHPDPARVGRRRGPRRVPRRPGRRTGLVPAAERSREAVAVAQDFMRHLATWHSTPARELELPSFGPVRSVREHQRDQLAGIEALFEREDRDQPIDAARRASSSTCSITCPTTTASPCSSRATPARQLHVRRRPRHRDRRLGARARR